MFLNFRDPFCMLSHGIAATFSKTCTKRNIAVGENIKRLITLISLKGINKLFSSLESKPKSRAASLKFLLVATNAFMVVRKLFVELINADQVLSCSKEDGST